MDRNNNCLVCDSVLFMIEYFFLSHLEGSGLEASTRQTEENVAAECRLSM